MAETKHVVVLGGGVVGVTSAYALQRSGLKVTLIERESGAALATSFANGGLITPSMSDPWAAPGLPLLLLKWIGRENSPFLVRPSALPGLVSWGLKFFTQCRSAAWRRNMENTLRLCRYSHEQLRQVAEETQIDFDLNTGGTLHLFRDHLSMARTKETAAAIGKLGVRFEILDRQGCIELEPALASQSERIFGGVHYPEDDAGNAHLFTANLAEVCAANGVALRYGETIRRIETERGAFSAVVTDAGRIEADACLAALGNGSPGLLRPLGIPLPIYPVKGYSLTFPVDGWNGAPRVPFVDDARKMGIVRLGSRLRVAGTAEFAGQDGTLNPKRIANLRAFFMGLFPDYPHPEAGEAWTGLRPTTPDGLPYLGATPVRGLYLNTGHGHLGWTMSCGSAQLVADIIQNRPTEIDLSGMTLEGR